MFKKRRERRALYYISFLAFPPTNLISSHLSLPLFSHLHSPFLFSLLIPTTAVVFLCSFTHFSSPSSFLRHVLCFTILLLNIALTIESFSPHPLQQQLLSLFTQRRRVAYPLFFLLICHSDKIPEWAIHSSTEHIDTLTDHYKVQIYYQPVEKQVNKAFIRGRKRAGIECEFPGTTRPVSLFFFFYNTFFDISSLLKPLSSTNSSKDTGQKMHG